jgi:hypothetical protein
MRQGPKTPPIRQGGPAKATLGRLGRRPGTPGDRPRLKRCQVRTPPELVAALWRLVRSRRSKPGSVLDLGAGDGRFSRKGSYTSYTGYELEPGQLSEPLPEKAKIVVADALLARGKFSVAIGNPPFMRVQDLSTRWRKRARSVIRDATGIDPGPSCNLYVYFLWFSLIHTGSRGIVALVVPTDWTCKPSGKPLRTYIKRLGWSVDV